VILIAWLAALYQPQATARDLTELSLEELMQVEVTSVSRKSQRAADAAAAIFVITQDDIRRSGVSSIPEALRLAPGLQVARIDSNKWAVSSRGFNGRFANKLLVLMDGRSVYTPTFSGVYWEVQDTLLEDVDRIEVIRGPGAAMWGSNAVNGVINIITQSAKDTQGGTFVAGGGSYEKRFGSLRYGAQLGESTFGRAYVKGFRRGEFDAVDRRSSNDGWDNVRGGFRIDREGNDGETYKLQGDLYSGNLRQGIYVPDLQTESLNYDVSRVNTSGTNLLGRWQKSLSLTSELSVQAYYDHTYRKESFLTEERDTLDLDAQHRFRFGTDHDIVWGLGYRWSRDKYSGNSPVTFDTQYPFRQLISGFLQDEVMLIPDQLKFTLGARLEHNDYTGFEGQPNARIAWTPNSQHTVWAAISRAIRLPSRGEDSARLTSYFLNQSSRIALLATPLSLRVDSVGNRRFQAETLWAYEIGYRLLPLENLSADVALFYNDYEKLRGNGDPILAADLSNVAVPFANTLAGNSHGAEVSLDWKPELWVRLQLNYSYLRMDVFNAHAGNDLTAKPTGTASPQQQASFRSSFAFDKAVDLDLWLRYVDRITTTGYPDFSVLTTIPSYVTLDARLAWRPVRDVELSVIGQNLLDSRHPEFLQGLYSPKISEIPRGVYLQLNAHF
jgi:iron complex outermembrane receptor protein